MADNYFKIVMEQEQLKKLFDKYGEDLTKKAIGVTTKYTNKIARDAKEIIDKYKYRDTGRLINSIKPSIHAYADRIVGEVNAGTKYAKFIHEGAKHKPGSEETERFFVPFRVAPSLYKWAKRNRVIETIDGVDRLVSTGQVVYPNKGGLLVHIAPTKYFEKPFNEYKNQFIKEISEIVGE